MASNRDLLRSASRRSLSTLLRSTSDRFRSRDLLSLTIAVGCGSGSAVGTGVGSGDRSWAESSAKTVPECTESWFTGAGLVRLSFSTGTGDGVVAETICVVPDFFGRVFLAANKRNRPKPIAMTAHRASKAPGAALLIKAFTQSCRCPEPLGWVFNRLLNGRWRRRFMDTFGEYTTGCGIQNNWHKIECKTPVEANAASASAQTEVLPAGPDLSSLRIAYGCFAFRAPDNCAPYLQSAAGSHRRYFERSCQTVVRYHHSGPGWKP